MKAWCLARFPTASNHAAGLAGLFLGFLIAVLSPPHAWAGTVACTASTGFTNCVRITYSGGLQSWTVPAGVTTVQVKVWGAAGGGANSFYWGQQAKGGGGGYSIGYLAVIPGQTLSLVVGQGGQLSSTSTTYGGGGAGGTGGGSIMRYGSSGGGYSGIFASSTLTQANARIIAGGGGGTSPGADTFTQGTGGGGGTTGGQDSFPALSGRGGSQAAGGAAANGANECLSQPTAGSALQGGTGAITDGTGEGGGGGGGGYHGGGGGLCQRIPSNNQNGGGGGGSGYLSASISSGSMTNGANATNIVGVDCTGTTASGGSSDAHYSSGIGQGSCFAAGGNGEVVIQYGMPTLTLAKTVTNDNGGSAAVTAWTLQAAGPVTISGTSGSAAVTAVSVNAGTYALSESGGPSGYAAGSWSCTAGILSGSNLTLSAGQNATCTINNNDTAPTLTLVKTISGDTTPSAVSSFTLTAAGPVTISGVTGAGTVTNASVNAGTYALSESGPSGYTAGAWSCTAGTLSGSSLTLSLAQTASCTITNTRLPTVAVQKVTTGGFGGPFDFADTNITGSFPIISTTVAGTAQPAAPTALVATLSAEATITETSSLAWLASGVSCSDANATNSGNTNPVATASAGSVTIPATANRAGAIITCVFTNTVAAPSLSIAKSANVPGPVNAGDVITYTFRVKNTGNVTITGIGVNDVFGGLGTDPVPGSEILIADVAPANDSSDGTSGPDGSWDQLAPGDEIEFTATYSVVQADIDAQ